MSQDDQIQQLRHTVATLIVWMAQSAVSPISVKEAQALLLMLPPSDQHEDPRGGPVVGR